MQSLLEENIHMAQPKNFLRGCILVSFLLFLANPAYADDTAVQVPILVYHEILVDNDCEKVGETVIALEKFAKQMKYLYDHGYYTISMDKLVQFMKGGSVPEKSILIHFDDGWKSVKYAIPILEQYDFKASFWIITEKGIGNDYLEWEDVIAMDQNPNFEVGSHTMTHPWDRLSNLLTWVQGKIPGKGIEDTEWELRESKKILEKKLNRKVPYLAWPCGWYNDTLIQIAKEVGYKALLTTDVGGNTQGGDIFRIKRVLVNGTCDMEIFQQILQYPQYHDPCALNKLR